MNGCLAHAGIAYQPYNAESGRRAIYPAYSVIEFIL
jgi:hypothetical protein